MHSTRVASFLLGAWLAVCVIADAVAFENPRLVSRFISSAAPEAAEIMKTPGQEPSRLLLRNLAWEQSRYYILTWARVQIPLAILVAGVLYFATNRRVIAPACAGLMLILVLFQAFAVIPEWIFRGRESDFPPASESVGVQARVWTLAQLYAGMEGAKLFTGTVLAAYVFSFKSRKRLRSVETEVEGESLGRARG